MAKGKTCLEGGCEARAIKRDMCEKHYKAWLRKQPQCRAEGCTTRLFPRDRKTRSDYCRPHEQLALTTRSKAAQEKTLARFLSAIEPDWVYGCWLWRETPDDGYGKFHAGGPWLAHRFAYVWFYGGHAKGKTLDHICNRKLCVRPDHMQVVTGTVNTKRRDARAFAPAGTAWVLGHIPVSPEMDAWAEANGLPYGNPAGLGHLASFAGVPTRPEIGHPTVSLSSNNAESF